MTVPLYANNVSTTLQAGLIPTDTLVVVTSASGMPSPTGTEYFYATIQSALGDVEIVKCTSRSGTTLTVERAQDGTAAQSFSVGATLELRLCAQLMRDADWRTGRNTVNGIAGLDSGAKVIVGFLPTNVNNGIAGLDANGKVAVAQLPVNTANGIVGLDGASKIPSAYLPAVALTQPFVAANEAAQLALTTQEGDVVVRTDESKTYIRNAGVTGTMADFTELLQPGAPVQSVNGQTGTVALDADDIGAVPAADVNAADGVAGLGSNSRIAVAQAALAEVTIEAGTTKSLVAADHGKVFKFTNGAAITVTAPDTLPDGFLCSLFQAGAGQITVAASGAVTLRARRTAKTAGQYAPIAVNRIENDIVVYGDTAAT